MATHSSIPPWKIPWTEEPGGLWSMGSQRVGHDWVTEHEHVNSYQFSMPQIWWAQKCCCWDVCKYLFSDKYWWWIREFRSTETIEWSIKNSARHQFGVKPWEVRLFFSSVRVNQRVMYLHNVPVSVSWGHCNKLPKTWWLKIAEFILSQL